MIIRKRLVNDFLVVSLQLNRLAPHVPSSPGQQQDSGDLRSPLKNLKKPSPPSKTSSTSPWRLLAGRWGQVRAGMWVTDWTFPTHFHFLQFYFLICDPKEFLANFSFQYFISRQTLKGIGLKAILLIESPLQVTKKCTEKDAITSIALRCIWPLILSLMLANDWVKELKHVATFNNAMT